MSARVNIGLFYLRKPSILSIFIVFSFTNLSHTAAADSDKLVYMAKKIILAGVEIGLDEAGGRLLGPTIWKHCKKILSPVVEALQEKYPALSFKKPGDSKAQQAASDAVDYLSSNSQLQRTLLDNFNSLETGQADILRSIDELDHKLETVGKDVGEILRILKQRTPPPQGKMTSYVDVSEVVDDIRALLLAKLGPERCGACWLVALGVGMVDFTQRVLEDGVSFATYRTEIYGSKYTAKPYGKYQDSIGRQCRSYLFSTQFRDADGEIRHTELRTVNACRIEGYWKPVDK